MRLRTADSNTLRLQIGASLVEVATASLVLSLTFFAVVSLVRSARNTEHEGIIQSQAQRIANSTLEENRYHHSNYVALIPETINYTVAETPVIFPAPEDPTRFVTPTKQVIVHPEQVAGPWSGIQVPYKVIEAVVTWTLNGTHTVRATKRVARAES